MNNKGIVFKVTRRYMGKNKKRTFTTFLGIFFMVLLMTCVFVGKDTAIAYLQKIAMEVDGKWHISFNEITQKQYEELNALEGVEDSTCLTDYGYSHFEKSGNEEKPYLQIKAYSDKCFDWMNVEVVEGRLPENEKEILISYNAIKDGADVKIGDTMQVKCFDVDFGAIVEDVEFEDLFVFNGIEESYKIVGFMEDPYFTYWDDVAYTGITFFDENTLPEKFNAAFILDFNKSNAFYEAYPEVVPEIQEAGLVDRNELLLLYTADTADTTINNMVLFMMVFFVLLIIAASVILIYNVFNISFEERSRYLGMLSSIGATRKQRSGSIYYEAFLLLVFALPTGFLAGCLVVKVGMYMLKPYIDFLMACYNKEPFQTISIQMSIKDIVFIVVLCAITVAISAFLPARKISKAKEIDCIRGNDFKKQKICKTNWKGLNSFQIEGMLAGNMLNRQKKKARGLIGSISVFMIILIVTSYSTILLNRMITYFLLEENDVTYEIEADYEVFTWGYGEKAANYNQLRETLIKDENVENITELYTGSYAGTVLTEVYSKEYWTAYKNVTKQYGYTEKQWEKEFEDWETQFVSILAVDNATMNTLVKKGNVDSELMNNSRIPSVIVVQNGGELSTANIRYGDSVGNYKFYEIHQMTDKKIGDEFTIFQYNAEKKEDVEYPVKIAGYITNEELKGLVQYRSQEMWLIMSLDAAKELEELVGKSDIGESVFNKNMYINLKNADSQLDAYIQQVNDYNDENLGVFSRAKNGEYEKEFAKMLTSIIKIMLFSFVLLTSVICMLNLYNSIRGRIVSAKREFAMLKSIGMTEKQLKKMLLLEGAGVIGKSMLATVFVATPLTFYIKYMLMRLFGYVKVAFPVYIYLIAILIAVVAYFAVTLYCYKAERIQNVIETIRNQNE